MLQLLDYLNLSSRPDDLEMEVPRGATDTDRVHLVPPELAAKWIGPRRLSLMQSRYPEMPAAQKMDPAVDLASVLFLGLNLHLPILKLYFAQPGAVALELLTMLTRQVQSVRPLIFSKHQRFGS